MPRSIDQLRRDAKALRRAHEAGSRDARALLDAVRPRPDGTPLKHGDFLHVIARQEGFASWPALAAAAEIHGMDRAARIQRLLKAMALGQEPVVTRLLDAEPDLAEATLALAAGFYRAGAVVRMLAADPGAATRVEGSVPPFIHFCRSRMHELFPDRQAEMLQVAEAFRAAGIDVNAGIGAPGDPAHRLSPLYFALGHAGNLALARWLLEQGADPNDGESLYHATELGDTGGVRLLLDFGADPTGTNALPRALDFDDPAMVRLLLEGGADPNEFSGAPVGGEAPFVIPALHQAARRMCSAEIVDLLIDAGADLHALWKGKSAYAHASVFGNAPLVGRLEAMGAATELTAEEALMAAAARGEDSEGRFLDPARLTEEFRGILRHLVHLPGKRDHVRRLAAIGIEYDRPEPVDGLTPVQAAGWEGLPEILGDLLALRPDLSHVNAYGGTLLSTIIHGSENNPARAGRDYIACLEKVLHQGVALPKKAIDLAGEPGVAAFLAEWGQDHPGQVVEYGIG